MAWIFSSITALAMMFSFSAGASVFSNLSKSSFTVLWSFFRIEIACFSGNIKSSICGLLKVVMRDTKPASNGSNDQEHVLLQRPLQGETVAIDLLSKSAELRDYF